MAEKRKIKLNIPIIMACVLFYFVMITTCMVGGLYARFTSSSSGEDSARTAAFHVTADSNFYSKDLVVELAPGTTTQTITIKNDSEVAVELVAVLENKTMNLPLKFLMYPQGQKPDGAEAVSNLYSFQGAMDVNKEQIFTVEIIWPQEDALEDMGKVDLINLSIRVVQID